MNRAAGFTLIEALVAMVIMAIISAASFSGLDVLMRSAEQLETARAGLRDLVLFHARLENGLANAVETKWREGDNQAMPPLRGAASRITFIRLGDGPGAGPKRIGYVYTGGKIEYWVWPAVSAMEGDAPEAYTAMEGVAGFEFSFLDHGGQWLGAWDNPRLPLAVKATITDKNGNAIWWIFDLPARG
jgi:general secretion pathway protein J